MATGTASETQPLLGADRPHTAPARTFGAKVAAVFGRYFHSPLLIKAVERTGTVFYDAATFEGSIWPAAIGPAFALSIWATLIVSIYELTDYFNALPNSIYFITVIGVAFGYLMVFRTNTAYERFWEGRRLWSQLQIQLVNFGRIVWFHVDAPDGKHLTNTDELSKTGALNLLVALAVSTKYHLQEKPGVEHPDLKPFLDFDIDLSKGVTQSSIPFDIILKLGAYITYLKQKNLIDGGSHGTLTGLISGLVETLTLFERICRTPIPRAYHIYIRQTLIIYIASLPFQITPVVHWYAIPVVFFGGGTLLGMEAIAREIENPFGNDFNDLPQDLYIKAIRQELISITKTPKLHVDYWGIPGDLERLDERMNSTTILIN